VYVWAKPGVGSQSRHNRKGPDPLQASSWLENGKTPAKLVFGRDTDIVLPASDEPYSVDLSGRRLREAGYESAFRHITVGRNANLSCGGDGFGRSFYGNVWVKAGGNMSGNGAAKCTGDQPTFFRCDTDLGLQKNILSQYISIAKADGVPTEILGRVDMLDEFMVSSPLIIGPDSRMHPGRAARPVIHASGKLILMDGAFFSSWTNYWENPDMTVKGGTIQAGLPERPLTRNAFWGLSYKNYTEAEFTHGDFTDGCHFMPSAILEDGSTLRSVSADIDKARLVVCWNNFLHGKAKRTTRWETVDRRYERFMKKEKDRLFMEWFDARPHLIDIEFGKDVTVDGVEFDHLHKGSLRTPLANPLTEWKRVYFGPHCQATGAEAFAGPRPE
jgi:hypothetical protein